MTYKELEIYYPKIAQQITYFYNNLELIKFYFSCFRASEYLLLSFPNTSTQDMYYICSDDTILKVQLWEPTT